MQTRAAYREALTDIYIYENFLVDSNFHVALEISSIICSIQPGLSRAGTNLCVDTRHADPKGGVIFR